jgi:hypothetical protein
VQFQGRPEDVPPDQLAKLRAYRDELEPIIAAFGEVSIFIRPRTPIPPAPAWPSRPQVPRDWQDHAGWARLLTYADRRDNRLWVVSRWARAAGGEVRDGSLHLPADLPHGLALAELKTHARICGLTLEDLRCPLTLPSCWRPSRAHARPNLK